MPRQKLDGLRHEVRIGKKANVNHKAMVGGDI